MRDFKQLLEARWDEGKFLCVGLDTDFDKIPEVTRSGDVKAAIVEFNRAIMNATKDIAGSYKLNSAFYEARGEQGWLALQESIAHIHEFSPDTPVILDAKRADIGNSNEAYVEAAFDNLAADAITVHPYLGREAIQPFLDRTNKGVFVLCRTSNPGATEIQDANVDGEPLYIHIARRAAGSWNEGGNCGIVVGATYPEEMKKIREAAPEITFLIPGIGTQGGDIAKTVECGKNTAGKGMVINASRAIIYASSGADFAEAAHAKALEFDGAIRAAL